MIIRNVLKIEATYSELNEFVSFMEENSCVRDLDVFHFKIMDKFLTRHF